MRVQAQLGMLLAQNGHAREAIQPLENVLRSAPDAVVVMPYLGRAYLQTGQAEKAVTVLHQALSSTQTKTRHRSLLICSLEWLKQIFMVQRPQGLTSRRPFDSTHNLPSAIMYWAICFCASETTKRPRRVTRRPQNLLRETISTRMM